MAKLGQASGQVHKCLTDPNLVEDGCTKNALFVLLTRHSMLIVMLVSISMHYGYYPQDIYLVDLTVVEFLMLEIQPTFFYKISPGLPFSMYIIMVGRKNALRNKITEKTEFVYFFF